MTGVVVRNFSGKLDLDTHPFRVAPADYIGAFNFTRDAQGIVQDGPLSNIVSNRQVVYTLPAGNNVCIGARGDKLRNRVYYFVYNDTGKHTVLYLDIATRTIVEIIQSVTDSSNLDILNFQLLYKVNDIDIVHRDEDGDLLIWNDGYNRPAQLNVVDFVNGIYPVVTDDLIRLQRMPPTIPIYYVYTTNTANKVNNLKKKLFQFSYAWGYVNGEISTIAPPSKVVLPINAYSVDTESDPSQNNAIRMLVIAGPSDYKFIRIFARESISANVFGDWFVVDTLNRADYSIDPGSTYNYQFLNDSRYVGVDENYTDLLFDNASDQCNAQAIVNGNVVVQGGITDGFDAIKRTDINVTITTDYKTTSGNHVTPAMPTITQTTGVSGGAYYTFFSIGPSVGSGSVYRIKLTWLVVSGPDLSVDVMYTANGTDTANSVATALVALIVTQASGKPFTVSVTSGNRVNIQDQQKVINGGVAPDPATYSAVPQTLQSGGSPTWRWNSKRRFGLVYKDKYGKSNGVVSFVSTDNDPTDFSVTTGDFAVDGTTFTPRVPIVNAIINHLPPAWAASYEWVRTADPTFFLDYITAEVQTDANYNYFCIENLNVFIQQNNSFVPSYTFQAGDRLRVYAEVLSASPYYTIPATIGDFEILGSVQRPMTQAVPPTPAVTTNGQYLKVRKSGSSPVYGPHMLIEIYRPSVRDSAQTQVFYTFGESYPIYTLSGVNYHVGQLLNQTSINPATFSFEDGDVYYKFREFYVLKDDGTINTDTGIYSSGVMDPNYSDYFNSAVNSNGAAWVIDPNAKRLYRPIEIRFSQEYQPGTDINGLNRFYPDDFIEVIRDFGDIRRMIAWNNSLIVFQRNKIGKVPVFQQILKNQDGSANLVVSDKLLNRVQYYEGECGAGDVPESIAWNNKAIYGWDSVRGISWRIAQNGLEFTSIVHKINSYAVAKAGARGVKTNSGYQYKIYGVFDTYTNKYITAFEAIPGNSAETLVWSESANAFESFVGYLPEMMVSINNLLISFRNGQLWTHDDATFNTFYGVVYESSVTAVFNDSYLMKKTWEAVTLQSNTALDAPSITTSVNSYLLPAPLPQQSNLVESDFELKEDFYHAALLRDANSGGINDGDVLKGSFLVAKFRKQNASNFIFLNAVEISFIESQLNKPK